MAISRVQPMRPAEVDLLDHMDSAEGDIAQLQEELAQETVNRQQADTALGTRIDDETLERTQADTALGNRLDTAEDDIEKYAYPKNNPIYYGADPTGTQESSDAINACIQANKGSTVIFTPGDYRIDNPINTPQKAEDRVSIDFNDAHIHVTTSTEYAIGIGFGDDSTDSEAGILRTFIRNLYLVNESACPVAIQSKLNYKDCSIINSNIIGFKNGIVIGDAAQIVPGDFQIENCYVKYTDMATDSNGIVFNTSDNKINDSRVYGFKHAFFSRGTGNFIDNVHALPKSNPTAETLENSDFIYQVASGANHIRNCYCDTLGAFLRFAATGTGHVDFCSNRMFSYRSDFKQIFIDAGAVTSRIIGIICDNNISLNGTNGNKTIVMPASDNLQHVFSDELFIKNNKLEKTGGFVYSYGDILTLKDKTAMYWKKVISPTAEQWTRLCAIPVTRNERGITLEINYPYTIALIERVSLIVNASSPTDENKNKITLIDTTANSSAYRYGFNIDTETFSYPVIYFYVNKPGGSTITTPISVTPNIYGVTDVSELADYLITADTPQYVTTI